MIKQPLLPITFLHFHTSEMEAAMVMWTQDIQATNRAIIEQYQKHNQTGSRSKSSQRDLSVKSRRLTVDPAGSIRQRPVQERRGLCLHTCTGRKPPKTGKHEIKQGLQKECTGTRWCLGVLLAPLPQNPGTRWCLGVRLAPLLHNVAAPGRASHVAVLQES